MRGTLIIKDGRADGGAGRVQQELEYPQLVIELGQAAAVNLSNGEGGSARSECVTRLEFSAAVASSKDNIAALAKAQQELFQVRAGLAERCRQLREMSERQLKVSQRMDSIKPGLLAAFSQGKNFS